MNLRDIAASKGMESPTGDCYTCPNSSDDRCRWAVMAHSLREDDPRWEGYCHYFHVWVDKEGADGV